MSGIANYIMNNDSIIDTEDRKERIVDIYVSAETVRDVKHKPMENSKPPQHTGSDSVWMKSSKAALVFLVLLYFLLLTAVIVLCVFIYTNNTNYTQDRNQLLTRITNITEEKDQLLIRNTNLTEENNKLIIKNKNLTNQLNDNGWIYYQLSFYNVSNEVKSWTESRRDCQQRGADLIIINNRQEQDFIMNITRGKECWIGLTDSKAERRWKWVDGSNMTSGMWASGEPNGGTVENCAVTYLTKAPGLLGWIDEICSRTYQYICEKSISPLIQP